MTRYHITGAAVQTTVSGTVASSGAVSITIGDASGWPDASVGPYACVIDPGQPNEEVVLVTARAGSVLTVTSGNRGWDGTTAAGHSNGAIIYPCIAATYVDEANLHQESTALHLGAGTVKTAHFEAGAVDTAALDSGAVTETKLGSAAVTSTKIAASAVTEASIASSAVTEAKIGAGAVTAAKLASDAVTTVKILNSNVTTAKIADGNVTLAKLAPTVRTISLGAVYEKPIGALESWEVELNGQEISRTTYADYHAMMQAAGYPYGDGDGSTTFNVEDRRGRFPVGQNTSDSDFDTIGETGGAKTHTLTQAQLPNVMFSGSTTSNGSHTHPSAAGNFVIIGGAGNNKLGHRSLNTLNGSDVSDTANTGSGGAHTHSVVVPSGGSGEAHNNLPPYSVTRWVVRAL